MTETDSTGAEPDPDQTQRIEHQEVVDEWMSGWPTTDTDRQEQRRPRRGLWHRLVVVPAAAAAAS